MKIILGSQLNQQLEEISRNGDHLKYKILQTTAELSIVINSKNKYQTR